MSGDWHKHPSRQARRPHEWGAAPLRSHFRKRAWASLSPRWQSYRRTRQCCKHISAFLSSVCSISLSACSSAILATNRACAHIWSQRKAIFVRCSICCWMEIHWLLWSLDILINEFLDWRAHLPVFSARTHLQTFACPTPVHTYTATHCNTLQHSATHCHTATRCKIKWCILQSAPRCPAH